MNRKINKNNIRKIYRQGKTSLSVTLPIDLVLELGWKERQKVVVTKQGRHLVIKDWK
jgi:antitoxin component of MazEF toxin-antitoxin module